MNKRTTNPINQMCRTLIELPMSNVAEPIHDEECSSNPGDPRVDISAIY